ncbi:MAG: diguanylate cyclase, partial [Chloroflexota bacterium]
MSSEPSDWMALTYKAFLDGEIAGIDTLNRADYEKLRPLFSDFENIHQFVKVLSEGDLSAKLNMKGQLAGNLKALQANLRHLTWQVQQVAAGDFSQRSIFMGEFAEAFNTITENLQQAIHALQSSEAHYRLFAENSMDVVWTMDMEGHFSYVSPTVERLRGFTSEEVIQQSLDEALTPQSAAIAKERLSQTIKTLSNGQRIESEVFELEQPCKDGSTVWTEVSIGGIYDDGDRFVGILGVSRNITERRQAQAAEREQRILAEAFRDTVAALNSAMNLDDVLDTILMNIECVVPSDTVDIFLVDDAGVACMKRYKGYKLLSSNQEEMLSTLQLSVQETANLKTMAETGLPLLIEDLSNYDWTRLPINEWAQSYLGSPIMIEGKAAGFLSLLSSKKCFFTQKHIERIQIFADQAAIAIQKMRLFEQMNILATTDGLTEISNRRYFLTSAEKEFERSIRYMESLSIIMIDIDHFKKVNDTYGHTTGDEVLHETAQLCKQSLREVDLIGRYGGEEFIILLPETDAVEAYLVAERLCMLIADHKFNTKSGIIHITASLGVASIEDKGYSIKSLLDHSDQALYTAKQEGRNRVKRYKPTMIQ